MEKEYKDLQKQIDNYKQKLNEFNDQIYNKSISLEYFWRQFAIQLSKPDQEWKKPVEKQQILRQIQNQMQNGDSFELIDGQNLEYKSEFLKEILQDCESDKVIVVTIIGPQSTGKSTLMNNSFSTQLLESKGRCIQGVYFTLQKIPEEIQKDNDVQWLLLLDTEGLQSPERLDDEYDRKIVLFALLNSDIVIINSKGEINSNMTNLLKISTINYDKIKNYATKRPQILYTFIQNNIQDTFNLKFQLNNLYADVVENQQSETIIETAEQILSVKNEKLNLQYKKIQIQVLGYASKIFINEQNEYNQYFKLFNPDFSEEASEIYKILLQQVKEIKSYTQLGNWFIDSKQNWNLIDRRGSEILQIENIQDQDLN